MENTVATVDGARARRKAELLRRQRCVFQGEKTRDEGGNKTESN